MIVVTGAAGFIGSNLVPYILNNTDFKVVNLDLLTYAGDLNNLSEIQGNDNYTFISTSTPLVNSSFIKASIVFEDELYISSNLL